MYLHISNPVQQTVPEGVVQLEQLYQDVLEQLRRLVEQLRRLVGQLRRLHQRCGRTTATIAPIAPKVVRLQRLHHGVVEQLQRLIQGVVSNALVQ